MSTAGASLPHSQPGAGAEGVRSRTRHGVQRGAGQWARPPFASSRRMPRNRTTSAKARGGGLVLREAAAHQRTGLAPWCLTGRPPSPAPSLCAHPRRPAYTGACIEPSTGDDSLTASRASSQRAVRLGIERRRCGAGRPLLETFPARDVFDVTQRSCEPSSSSSPHQERTRCHSLHTTTPTCQGPSAHPSCIHLAVTARLLLDAPLSGTLRAGHAPPARQRHPK